MEEPMAQRMSRLRNEAVYAAEVGDYATALTKLDAARIIYDTTPNSEKDGLRVEWRRIEPLIGRLEKLDRRQKGSGKLQRVAINYRDPNCGSVDCCRAGGME